MKKANISHNKLVKNNEYPIELNKPIYKKNDQIYIIINGKPNSKINSITDIGEDSIGVSIAAQPQDNKANEELIQFMTSLLGVKKNQISLDKGSKSRNKLLMVQGTQLNEADVEQLLKNSIKK